MFHRPKPPPLPNPHLIALPSCLPTTTADLAPDPSPSYHHHAHLVMFMVLVSLLQHFCCYHQAYPAQSSSRLQIQETTDREVFQLPARFESTQNRPISRTLVFSVQVHPVLTEPVCLAPRSLPDTCASFSFHHHRPTLAQQQPTTITPSNHCMNHHCTVVQLSPFKFTSSTRVNAFVRNNKSSVEVLCLPSMSQQNDISSRLTCRSTTHVSSFLSTAPTSFLQWRFMQTVTHLCRCAVEFRRIHPLRPPPEPDECTHANPACHAVEIRHSQLQITALIWFISWPNDRHDNRRIRLFRRLRRNTRDRARPRTRRQTRAWSRWGSSAPNPAVKMLTYYCTSVMVTLRFVVFPLIGRVCGDFRQTMLIGWVFG